MPVMLNNPTYVHSKLLNFEINKCRGQSRKYPKLPCKTDAEINKFIYDIEISGYHVEESIDLSIRDRKPVYKSHKQFGHWIFDRSHHINTNIYL